MRKGQNRKVKVAGRASCLGLLALGLALVNPVGSLAFAEEAEDYGTDTYADIPSTIGISFAPASGSASLSPTTVTGQSAQVNVLATVDVQNSGGYAVYLRSNSQNLVGANNPSNVIPGISGSATYNDLTVNTWGYYAGEGASVPEGATYKAISVSGNGDKVAENGSNKIKTDRKNIMLSFAAKINDAMPADTYQNTVTLSVVSSPLQTTLTDIASMQDMTAAICSASAMYETKQLKDVRDGKYYWVTKLADNRCWMTQNLDLNLGSEWPDASKSDYTTASATYTPIATQTQQTADTVDASQASTRSWDFGEWVMKNPAILSGCAAGQRDLTNCTAQLTNVAGKTASTDPNFYITKGATVSDNEYDAHYLVGNYYSWNAATAGTGGMIASGEAAGSICPKGWKLPTSTVSGEFRGLMDAYSISGSDVDKLTDSPLYFVRGGYVSQNADTLFTDAGFNGLYWSSTRYNDTFAFDLFFWGSGFVDPSYGHPRNLGESVRCIAK